MPVLTKINTNVIADNAVTSAKIPADAVGHSEIADVTGVTTTHYKVPSVTTSERDALTGVVGMLIYNTTLGMLQQYNAQGWAAIDSPPTVSSLDYPGDDTALDTVGEFALTGSTTANTDATVTVSSTTNLALGMLVTGTGIPSSTTVLSITSGTVFELSANATATGSANVTLTFNTQTLIITGTNFQVGATVLIDGTAPSTVTRNSSTQITVTGTPAKTAGTKSNGLSVTNPTGLAGSIDVEYSALPAWTTASGNVGSLFITGSAISTIDLAATSATSYAITTGSLPPGLAMSTSTGDITGTITGSTLTTYNFTVTATDAEAQSSPRLFNMTTNALPTGGTVTTPSGYRVHTFLLAQSGTNFVNGTSLTVDYLVVAGGGGGGGSGPDWVVGGGGGAGGYFNATSYSLAAGTHAITVGAGGNGATGYSASPGAGTNSVFGSIQTANGGGFGGSYNVTASTGGSGGGGTTNGTTGGASTGGGNAGGNGMNYTSNASIGAGGGGGSSAVGGNGSASVGGAGGNGTTITISGASVEYAAGGGGAHGTNGSGNEGGSSTAGDGATGENDGGDATDNFGDGGGGATSGDGAVTTGGDGGNGVVIIRYAY